MKEDREEIVAKGTENNFKSEMTERQQAWSNFEGEGHLEISKVTRKQNVPIGMGQSSK